MVWFGLFFITILQDILEEMFNVKVVHPNDEVILAKRQVFVNQILELFINTHFDYSFLFSGPTLMSLLSLT